MARALGLRWIIVHPPLYKDPASGAAIVDAVRGATTHVARVVPFEAAAVAELRPAASRTSVPADPAWREVPPREFTASASHNPDGLRRAFDGDRGTRWFTGARQRGAEWIELRFASLLDVARVRLEMDRRSNGDYPRGLLAEGSEDGRSWRTLFEGGVLSRLGLSIAYEPRTPGIDLVLPPNTTRVLRLRTTGETRVWYWSVHELRVWTR
jgi:streptogramin lyase